MLDLTDAQDRRGWAGKRRLTFTSVFWFLVFSTRARARVYATTATTRSDNAQRNTAFSFRDRVCTSSGTHGTRRDVAAAAAATGHDVRPVKGTTRNVIDNERENGTFGTGCFVFRFEMLRMKSETKVSKVHLRRENRPNVVYLLTVLVVLERFFFFLL